MSDTPERTPVPLPERPSLEFERKRAKRRLRALRRTHPDARLADAQRLAAREYGFTSWPRLVEYFRTWERHERTGHRSWLDTRDHYAHSVRHLLALHRHGTSMGARMLATFVPRFYGRTDAEVLATPITEGEAQLTVARQHRFPSWQALMDSAPAVFDKQAVDSHPRILATRAVRGRDLDALARLIDAHPELIATPSTVSLDDSALYGALMIESREQTAETRAVTDWLVARGAELQPVLDRMLIGGMYLPTEVVAFLLDRGADPNWMPPNGITVLEHALLRYWKPETVDLIARRVVPRRAFWIAAGLGDVPGVLSYLDQHGRPTDAARRDRPDFTACCVSALPNNPEADDLTIVWEAFFVAGMNHRLAVLDALLDRGFPIDYDRWGSTLLDWAAGNRIAVVADHLLKRGARPPRE